jgi:hypothetical protein
MSLSSNQRKKEKEKKKKTEELATGYGSVVPQG